MQYLLIDDEVRQIYVKHNQIFFSDTNKVVPDKYTKQFKSQLLRANIDFDEYNGKLFARLTNTPYHFWKTLDEEGKQKAVEILYKVAPELKELRDSRLKKLYEKRAKRAITKRWNKS